MTSRWIRNLSRFISPLIRLFCLPHTGGVIVADDHMATLQKVLPIVSRGQQ